MSDPDTVDMDSQPGPPINPPKSGEPVSYDVFYAPKRIEDDTFEGTIALVPMLIASDGRRVVSNKVLTGDDVLEKVLSFSAGFELHTYVEDSGGFDAIHAQLGEAAAGRYDKKED